MNPLFFKNIRKEKGVTGMKFDLDYEIDSILSKLQDEYRHERYK